MIYFRMVSAATAPGLKKKFTLNQAMVILQHWKHLISRDRSCLVALEKPSPSLLTSRLVRKNNDQLWINLILQFARISSLSGLHSHLILVGRHN